MGSKSEEKPHAVVGIDFGTECLKVALAFLNEAENTPHVKDMLFESSPPGCEGHELTAIAYQRGPSSDVRWGYAVKKIPKDQGWHTFSQFKLDALINSDTPCLSDEGTMQMAGPQLCVDVLRLLLPEVANFYKAKCGEKLPVWDKARVDIVLSVPAAVGQDGGAVLVDAARRVGFENTRRTHRVLDIGLTEPEAAMLQVLHESKDRFKNGDHILVVDVGGGTSDLSMVVLADRETGPVKTDFFQPVTSQQLGSVNIDGGLRASIIRGFEQCLPQESLTPGATTAKAARKITDGDAYRWAKHSFRDSSGDRAMFGVDIADLLLPDTIISPPAELGGIRFDGTAIRIRRSAITALFDRQIYGHGDESRGIIGQIRNMLDDLWVSCASRTTEHTLRERDAGKWPQYADRLDFLVFAGGMGANAYVQDKIKAGLEREQPPALGMLSNITAGVQYVVAESPQHCVSQGLVRARMREVQGKQKKGGFWRLLNPFFKKNK
ncbi:hypothetical protein RB601_003527 [Gaeumannomyces tritici]